MIQNEEFSLKCVMKVLDSLQHLIPNPQNFKNYYSYISQKVEIGLSLSSRRMVATKENHNILEEVWKQAYGH